MLGLIILGGIYFGIYTPTEAAAIGCVVALVIIIAKRRMTWSLLNNALQGTLYTSCMIYMIIAGAGLNAYVIEYLRIPILLIEWIRDLGLSNYMVLTAVCIIYYIMGCFVEGIAMCIITIPVIQPVMVALGFDPFWFGVIMVICVEVGMITPPLGINLYVIQGIDPESNFAEIIFGTIPYVAIMTILIVILSIYPQLATWLPSMM
jgi:tripartite ATP-independent transporter DctM subunit